MAQRWRVLTLLFLIRTGMAFQFATIGALGPLVGDSFQIDAAGLGFLIGLYLAPGLIMAVPGGAVGKMIGDKNTVLIGLAIMVIGGLVSAYGATWEMQITGRILAGAGGVILNVLMSKMVTDWFAGYEIATAMAIFVNSWPAGIALALVVQPFVGLAGGLETAFLLTAAFAVAGFVALRVFYSTPESAAGIGGSFPTGAVLLCVILGGTIWGLYNAAFAMIFNFGPSLLVGRGWELTQASSTTSIAIWVGVVSVPLGGIIADRSRHPNLVLVLGCSVSALVLWVLPRVDQVIPIMALTGIVFGVPVGAIMSLPARVLAPETRALGMGMFLTMFYVFVVISPSVAGYLIDATGWDGAAMDLGAVMLLATLPVLAMFEGSAKRLN